MFSLLNFPWWAYLLACLILTQTTIASVTIYLHRYQTHRALKLHPVVSHFFRFWLWLTTGMVTAEWVAIHRKHHATTDVKGDPHSPKVFGIKKVFWQVPELYRDMAKDKDLIKKYSHGTPDDFIERKLYSRHNKKGILLMFFIDLLLFGSIGITIWAIQMMWIPLSAGVINGIGHFRGYRNFECPDASTNVFPFGLFIGGEELHNNHHAFASSAKFSMKWWEVDLGWFYIRCLSLLGLAQVKKLPPQLRFNKEKNCVDLDTVKAVIGNRFQILSEYYRFVMKPIVCHETRNKAVKKTDKRALKKAGKLLKRDEKLLSIEATSQLHTLLGRYHNIQLVHHYRQSLQKIWLKTSPSQEQLIESLHQWCKQAETSGLEVLRQFALHLKGYGIQRAFT
ncbi:DesA family fatty acid desaturase [Legionella jordanis]|uniref:Stearoyl-CoA-9-desaturase n=1 Tax=Legionella jordanis TaxID=456 RepID=A0A0W0VCF8_9GAMM|nr:fatty acid desaturase [Legionella jordanis]KTD17768.1 stearoyl-CoA-9-desaturase [Legionella jordanis]RMX02526.1 acyl-CoA desaturase [Legionella jordanis]RMX21626.1 acyl-CoA desaturase [Legionella jordanis]VEH11296.1 stearoyl-CoA desaturase [Legionella jordanis]